jgi:hypothetical protein
MGRLEKRHGTEAAPRESAVLVVTVRSGNEGAVQQRQMPIQSLAILDAPVNIRNERMMRE